MDRLALNGYVMAAGDESQRYRSRMAELARELRYVKQRFRPGDADKRPFLVRSLKLEVRNREKPTRDQSLKIALDDLGQQMQGQPHAQVALEGIGAMLRKAWGDENPQLAAFQIRGLRQIMRSWFDDQGSPTRSSSQPIRALARPKRRVYP